LVSPGINKRFHAAVQKISARVFGRRDPDAGNDVYPIHARMLEDEFAALDPASPIDPRLSAASDQEIAFSVAGR
jgi:hypothetical protein